MFNGMLLLPFFPIFLLIDFPKDQSCDQDRDDENNNLTVMVKYLGHVRIWISTLSPL